MFKLETDPLSFNIMPTLATHTNILCCASFYTVSTYKFIILINTKEINFIKLFIW